MRTLYWTVLIMAYSNCVDGDVHLVGGASKYQGRVEVCLNRAWGTVCASNSQDSKEAGNQIGALTIIGIYEGHF